MLLRSAVVVSLFCLPGVARAGDKPIYQAAPAWIVPAPEPDFAKLTSQDPMIVIHDQQQRLADGQVWSYVDQAMRVGSSQMLGELGQVSLPWAPDTGDLIVHRMEIVRGKERIDLLAGDKRFQVLQREEQMEQRMLNGLLTATMSVEGLRVGDVLRLSYSVTSKDKALAGNLQAFQGLMAAPARAKFARARLSWPASSALAWRSYAEGVAPAEVTKGSFKEVEFALPLAKPAELPEDAPMRFRPLSILEASSFADWKAVSRTMGTLYEAKGLIAAGSPLAAEVAKIAAKTSDPRQRAALALRLVQDEVRYLFKGMDGGNYIPQAPAQTWALRYGDCKAKTLLLLAMLRELGIEAEAVAANSALGDLVPKRLPSAGAFDHVLVRATVNGQALWLDGTGAGTRLADLEDVPAFGNVLPLRVEGAELLSLAPRAPARAIGEITIEYDQRAGLTLPTPFTITAVTRGPMAGMMHAGMQQMSKEQRDEMAQGLIRSTLGDGLLIGSAMSYDDETASATITVNGVATTQWKTVNARLRFQGDKTLNEFKFEPDRARSAWRSIPVATGPSIAIAYRMRMLLPDKGNGFELEGDTKLDTVLGGVHLTRSAALANGTLTLDDRMEGSGAEIPAEAVAAARAQANLAKSRALKLVAPAGYPVRWKSVAGAKRNGGLAPLLAAFDKAVANDPEEVTPYLNRARFLAGVWDWKAALKDYDKAIALEPTAGMYLERGRVREALKDDTGALADAKAALELEPGAHAATARVATLELRKGDKDAALAMVAERVAEGGDAKADFVILQAELLGEAGRAEEALTALDGMIKSKPGQTDLLNSRCWIKGTRNVALETGLADCTRAIELAEQPANIHDSRAMVYYRLGRLPEALADLDAALEVAPNQVASLYLRGIVRRAQGNKAGDEDLAAARMLWPRIDEEYAGYGIKP